MAKLKQLEPPASPYHHGDLRRALLESAQAILAETSRWDFSLREVARRAEVSHNAPYRHFADKEALLAAIGVAGYEAMGERGAGAVAGLTAPADLLAALGKAYVAFGVSNPALYRLMFGQALPSVEGLPPALLDAIGVARNQLHGVILAGAQNGSFDIDPNDTARVGAASIAAWSLVHGLTLLTIDRLVERDTGAEAIDDLSGQVVELFVAGLRPKG
ncbi:TetR/AcrR family transcriptional regulator [Lichenihabitans sp. Uapishka_5]|uniref:TetR/AcrR family transcriptional regulator n=1 Tax=Lichenihabitans sp. Uapishka_5 TaxID=3037302 RepID=UPI0029E813F9|nr:TetR/AcrR family transcriptional regulator [Lichenihabitans sp. Uapishka_5]MDX7952144.1 TetR/AcrR family transcriptional regulator [Lichenihabitans sp. Uapishka_5]